MKRLLQIGSTVVVGAALVAVVVLVSGFRLPASVGAAPGGSIPPDVPHETRAPAESVAPLPSAAVSDGEPPLSPLDPAEAPNDECITVGSIVERAPMTLSSVVKFQRGAVLASVVDVGPAQWNTPDGRPPVDLTEITPSDVIRLVRLSVEDVWSGDAGATMTIAIPGGRIGCWDFWAEDVPARLERGQRFAVFVHGHPRRPDLGEAHALYTMWPVDGDGRVHTPADGPVPVTEMGQRIQRLKGN